jgi:hypothetical protein
MTYPSSIIYHLYGTGPAFVVTNAAALAVIQICRKEPFRVFRDARFRTKQIADTALDAFRIIIDRLLCPPASGQI